MSTESEQHNQEKQAVAVSSVLASILLVVLKTVVGYQTGSLGIISEALHSALDLVAAVITVMAVTFSSRPPDKDHHYGHGKVENISALVETLLLVGTCYWIIGEALARLTGTATHILEPSFWAYAVMVISIVVDYNRSRALHAAATKYSSQALEADAIHFSSDILSSGVVILGLIATQVGRTLGKPWLEAADPVAALFVAGVVLWVSFSLGKRTVDALVDRAPEVLMPAIETALLGLADVLACDRIRVRTSGHLTFVELTLAFDRNVPLARTQEVVNHARTEVDRLVPGADVVVQVETRSNPEETVQERIRAAAAELRMSIHNIAIHHCGQARLVELHLEIEGSLPLSQAHAAATELEERIRREVPRLTDVLIRMEGRRSLKWDGELPAEEASVLKERLTEACRSVPSVLELRDLVIMSEVRNLSVSCRCIFPGDMPVAVVNARTYEIERLWRKTDSRIDRITIHQEPAAEASS